MPTSVVLGSDPVNGPRYYYVYEVMARAVRESRVILTFDTDERDQVRQRMMP